MKCLQISIAALRISVLVMPEQSTAMLSKSFWQFMGPFFQNCARGGERCFDIFGRGSPYFIIFINTFFEKFKGGSCLYPTYPLWTSMLLTRNAEKFWTTKKTFSVSLLRKGGGIPWLPPVQSIRNERFNRKRLRLRPEVQSHHSRPEV